METGSDLLVVDSAHEDAIVTDVLSGLFEYSHPVYPGYYHIGFYQDSGYGTYYRADGGKVYVKLDHTMKKSTN